MNGILKTELFLLPGHQNIFVDTYRLWRGRVFSARLPNLFQRPTRTHNKFQMRYYASAKKESLFLATTPCRVGGQER